MSDREKVVRAVETCFDSWIDGHRNMGLDLQAVEQMKHDALELLKEQEAIVRCKDCRYLNEDSGICVIGIKHGYRDTWFCAYGKRR